MITRHIVFAAMRFRKMDGIKPVAGPAFCMARRREQAID
jgi:hypothetical protein